MLFDHAEIELPRDDESEASPPESAEPEDARVAYNDASSRLSAGDFDAADRLFEAARSAAGTDGEVRYRATYGLGFSAAARADSLLESAPDQALEALYRAGDYFRESVRLQPANQDPRHNLEIVLQRTRVLADTLARQDEKEIASALDELIERQRAQDAAIRGLLEAIAVSNPGASLDDSFRQGFRGLSTQQRQILSDGDAFAERTDRERSAIESKTEEEVTPEDRIRAIQLEQLAIYLQRARERMGHARRELRGRRGERAYRRSAAALAELKRARDQLRNPVEILDALLRDGSELARYTQAMAVLPIGLPGTTSGATLPPWLSHEYLRETQLALNDRAGELFERLSAGASQAETLFSEEPTVDAESAEAAQQLAERQRMMRRIVAALPSVESGVTAFDEALVALEVEDSSQASASQRAGLLALAEAREHFLELRGLIELTHEDQKRLHEVLAVSESSPEEAEEDESGGPPDLAEYLPALREVQQRNLDRSERISSMIEEEQQALPPAEPSADPSDPEAASAAAEAHQRLDLAGQILLLTQSAMSGVADGLAEMQPGRELAEATRASSDQALRGVENLRRLFFSLIEHLREAAQRQRELNDETEALTALDDDDRASKLGPVLPRQAALAESTGAIANALEEQSRENPGALVNPDVDLDPAQQDAVAEEAVRLRRAAELTLAAQTAMEAAGEKLAAEEPGLAEARSDQDEALQRILEALEALSPPQQPQDDPQQQEQQQQNEQQQQQQQSAEQEQQQTGDPSQLLQEVRDRDAQRRREKAERQRQPYDTVEKDW